MDFYQITFGPYNKKTYVETGELILDYLAALTRNGQIDKTYDVVPWQGQSVAYVNALGHKAESRRFHSIWGKEYLKQVCEFFRQKPVWTCNEDFPLKRNATWKDAPFLYLFTHLFDQESPVCRGDNGMVIPVFTLPITDLEKEYLYAWMYRYRDHDAVWMGSDELEIPSYRLLAEPDSGLSTTGREHCSIIEKATGVPTYYFLMRYYGREYAEEKARRCPGCGKPWFVKNPEKESYNKPFWKFDFMCKTCRLVSNCGPDGSNLRYAKIGEPRKKSQSPKRNRGEK